MQPANILDSFSKFILSNENSSYATKKIIPDDSDIIIIGDIHSSFHSLYQITLHLRSKNCFIENTMKLYPNKYIIFTGDIVDYGPYGLEVLWYILTLLYHNEDQIIICKGNHEDIRQYSHATQIGLNFKIELETQLENEPYITKIITQILTALPTVVFVTFKNKIYQFNHGSIDLNISGFSYDEKGIFDINKSKLFTFLNNTKTNLSIDQTYGNSYKWGDFYYNPYDPTVNAYNYKNIDALKIGRPKHHIDLIKQYLKSHNIECIISGHQDTAALGILPVNQILKEKQIDANGDKLIWTEFQGMLTTGQINQNNFKKDNYKIILNPGKDTLAVTMSTAVPSKLVNFHTFGILN
jgi:predicted MPP superfamily phosphohydrolase